MLSLQKFTNQDYDRLIGWITNAEDLMQFAGPGFCFPLTAAQLDVSANNANRLAYKVVDEITGITIGHAEIHVTPAAAYLTRILIGDEDARSKGKGSEIVRLLLEVVFTELKMDNAALNVFDWNTAAIRCYYKAGFEINPDKKAERTVNGKTWIALNMIMDRTRWKLLDTK